MENDNPIEIEVQATRKQLAIIVGIEEYQFALNKVDYAIKDAKDFRELLIGHLNFRPEEVLLWINERATRTALENELPYYIRQLEPDTRFIFYYAGHGFGDIGQNRLTCWDTYPNEIRNTSVLVADILLNPLAKAQCQESLLFFDACSSNLTSEARDVITGMSKEEFEAFVSPKKHQAQFFSCSPGQVSYSNAVLQNGIWTSHLIKALKGEAPEAIHRDRAITDASLRDYLSAIVPRYIRDKTQLRKEQNPWAHVTTANTFAIHILPPEKAPDSPIGGTLSLRYEGAFLKHEDRVQVSSLGGFATGHKVPKWHSDATVSFVLKAAHTDVEEELEEIRKNSKNILKLKHKEIETDFDSSGGTVSTPHFIYSITVSFLEDDLKNAVFLRTLTVKSKLEEIPEDLHEIFPKRMDQIVIPFYGKPKFDTLVDILEDVQDRGGGRLNEDASTKIIIFTLPDGSGMTIDCNSNELIIEPCDCDGKIKELLIGAQQVITTFSGADPRLTSGEIVQAITPRPLRLHHRPKH